MIEFVCVHIQFTENHCEGNMFAVRRPNWRVAHSARMESTSKHGLQWRAALFLTSSGKCENGPRGHVERLIRCGGQAEESDADCNFKRLERDWSVSLSQHRSVPPRLCLGSNANLGTNQRGSAHQVQYVLRGLYEGTMKVVRFLEAGAVLNS